MDFTFQLVIRIIHSYRLKSNFRPINHDFLIPQVIESNMKSWVAAMNSKQKHPFSQI